MFVLRILLIMLNRRFGFKGWLYASTRKGKLIFLRLRDGTGIVQVVAFRPEVGDALFEQLKRLGQESALMVTGTVRENNRAPGIPGGYEVGLESVTVLQDVADYPITPEGAWGGFFDGSSSFVVTF